MVSLSVSIVSKNLANSTSVKPYVNNSSISGKFRIVKILLSESVLTSLLWSCLYWSELIIVSLNVVKSFNKLVLEFSSNVVIKLCIIPCAINNVDDILFSALCLTQCFVTYKVLDLGSTKI